MIGMGCGFGLVLELVSCVHLATVSHPLLSAPMCWPCLMLLRRIELRAQRVCAILGLAAPKYILAKGLSEVSKVHSCNKSTKHQSCTRSENTELVFATHLTWPLSRGRLVGSPPEGSRPRSDRTSLPLFLLLFAIFCFRRSLRARSFVFTARSESFGGFVSGKARWSSLEATEPRATTGTRPAKLLVDGPASLESCCGARADLEGPLVGCSWARQSRDFSLRRKW